MSAAKVVHIFSENSIHIQNPQRKANRSIVIIKIKVEKTYEK